MGAEKGTRVANIPLAVDANQSSGFAMLQAHFFTHLEDADLCVDRGRHRLIGVQIRMAIESNVFFRVASLTSSERP